MTVLQALSRSPSPLCSVFSKGYTCFNGADINGDMISSANNVTSSADCAMRCEQQSELCTLFSYTPALQTCRLMNNAFNPSGGSGSQAGGKTACLRSASGGEVALIVPCGPSPSCAAPSPALQLLVLANG